MYVCVCHGITDRQIREAADRGASRLAHLRRELGLGGTCGKCATCAREILSEVRSRERQSTYPTDLVPAFA